MVKFNAVRGVKDILPSEVELWQYVENNARKILHNYGFREIRIPIFEYTPLFIRTIGETTDIVEKEMYTFLDKKGRSLTLRPEGTVGVVRAYLESNLGNQAKTSKLYYIGPMFRYERPQSGRLRQFHQIGAEIIGTDNPLGDVEIIMVSMDFFNFLGLKNLKLYINNLGCGKCRPSFKEAVKEYLLANKSILCGDCQRRIVQNPLRALDCKIDSKKLENVPIVTDFLCSLCSEHFAKVKEMLELLKIEYIIDPCLVRGLDYYTKTIFEIKTEILGAQDTVAAGGRYDNLVNDLGGPEGVGAVGFSLGLERLIMLIKTQELKIPLTYKTDIYIATLGEKARNYALNLLFSLRRENLSVENGYEAKSLKAQLRYADKSGAIYALIIGDEEINRDKIGLHNMKDGTQEEIKSSDIIETMLRKIKNRD